VERAWAGLIAALAASLLLAACGGGGGSSASEAGTCGPDGSRIASIPRNNQRSFPAPPEMIIDPARQYEALIRTNKGNITIDLKAADAPMTVNNFVFLSCTGFYDGLTFHRVELLPAPFVVQGGDPRGDGTGGPGYRFPNEISPNLRHEGAGAVGMANSGPDTNGSQFYITLNPAPNLDTRYTVFGRVTGGMNAVRDIRVGDVMNSVSIVER
jgi:cyclophilin family peptidyl-prolyl cis-trans isomerase